MYPLAFAPTGLWPLAIASVVLLFVSLEQKEFWHSLGILFSFGIGRYAIGTSWTYEGIITLGSVSPEIATVLVCLLVVFCAAYFAIVTALIRSLLGWFSGRDFIVSVSNQENQPSNQPTHRVFGWSIGWLGFEFLNFNESVDFSFPWLHLGYAFIDTWLAGLATIGGVLLVSTSALLIATVVYKFVRLGRWGIFWLGFPFVLGGVALQMQWTEPDGEVDVALVQANVSIAEKFLPDGFARAWEPHVELTQQATQADLIIWSEGALPSYEDLVRPYFRQLIEQVETPIVSGAYVRQSNNKGVESILNAVVGYEPNDTKVRQFHKTKLVPFGEYMPFAWITGYIRDQMDLNHGDLERGRSDQKPMEMNCCTLGVSVCYEIAFPSLIKTRARDSDFLISVSEDGWFGNSMGPAQHMQIARMRAIETGRYIVRSTSSGISGVIDNKGRIIRQLPSFEAAILESTIVKRHGSTWFMKVPELLAWVPSFLLIFLGQGLWEPLLAIFRRSVSEQSTEDSLQKSTSSDS